LWRGGAIPFVCSCRGGGTVRTEDTEDYQAAKAGYRQRRAYNRGKGVFEEEERGGRPEAARPEARGPGAGRSEARGARAEVQGPGAGEPEAQRPEAQGADAGGADADGAASEEDGQGEDDLPPPILTREAAGGSQGGTWTVPYPPSRHRRPARDADVVVEILASPYFLEDDEAQGADPGVTGGEVGSPLSLWWPQGR